MGKGKIPGALQKVSTQLSKRSKIDGIGITMTAELSDVFESKFEGVKYILEIVEKKWSNINPLVMDNTGHLISINEACKNYLRVSSANWAATSEVLAKIFQNCILIDTGSTTTDIIPIINHKVAVSGRTDTDRLSTGELVYTGILRSSIPSIVHSIRVKGKETGIASEIFALTADVHFLLGNISQEEYSTETADSRGTSREECLSRLARTVCADTDLLGEPELIRMAYYIYNKQVEKIGDGLKLVWKRLLIEEKLKLNFPIITTGLGGRILGRDAASKQGFRRFFDMGSILGIKDPQAVPAVSTALLVAENKGEKLVWPTY